MWVHFTDCGCLYLFCLHLHKSHLSLLADDLKTQMTYWGYPGILWNFATSLKMYQLYHLLAVFSYTSLHYEQSVDGNSWHRSGSSCRPTLETPMPQVLNNKEFAPSMKTGPLMIISGLAVPAWILVVSLLSLCMDVPNVLYLPYPSNIKCVISDSTKCCLYHRRMHQLIPWFQDSLYPPPAGHACGTLHISGML